MTEKEAIVPPSSKETKGTLRYALTRSEPTSDFDGIPNHYLRNDNSFGPYDPKLTKTFKWKNFQTGEGGDDSYGYMKTHWPRLDYYDEGKMERRPSWIIANHPNNPDCYLIRHEGPLTHYLHSDGDFKGFDIEKTMLFDTPEAAHEHAKVKKLLNTTHHFAVSKVEPSGYCSHYGSIRVSNKA